MNGYANHVLEFDPASGKYGRFEFYGHIFNGILLGTYFLLIEPIIVSREDIRLSFEIRENLGSNVTAKRTNRYFKEEVFNRVIEMRPDQSPLVGFAPPKFKDRFRGSAYWFIIKWIGKDANIVLEIENKKIVGYKNYCLTKHLHYDIPPLYFLRRGI